MNYGSQSYKGQVQLAKRMYNGETKLDWGFRENVYEVVIFMLNLAYHRTLNTERTTSFSCLSYNPCLSRPQSGSYPLIPRDSSLVTSLEWLTSPKALNRLESCMLKSFYMDFLRSHH